MGMRASGNRVKVVVAFVLGLLVAGGPQVAIAAFDAVNADKVDGRHAVGAGATLAVRAGKLVATNSSGRLPNDIITKAPDADRLDGLNSSAFARAGARTVFVGSSGAPAANGTALRNALTSIPTTGAAQPSASNGWLVRLEPGVYDLGGTSLAMRDFVDIEGAGDKTEISCACGDTTTNATVIAANATLRSLFVHNTGGTGANADGIVGDQVPVVLENVRVRVENSNGASALVGVSLSGWTGVMRHVDVALSAWIATGVDVSGGPSTIEDLHVSVTPGSGGTGLRANGATTVTTSTLHAAAGLNTSRPLLVQNGSVDVRSSTLTGSSVSLSSGTTMRLADSLVGAGVTGAGTRTCVGAFNASYVELSTTCS